MTWTQPSGPLFWFPCLHMLPNCPTIIMNSILLSTVQCKHSLFGRNLIFQFWIKHSRSNFDPPFNLDLCARKSGKGRSVDISRLLIVDQHVHSSRWGDYAHSQHAFPFINNFPTICLESFWKAKYTTSKVISVDKKIVVYGGGFTDIEYFGVKLVSSKMS